jgi:hypothetical protein
MRTFALLTLVACSHPTATPPSNLGGDVATATPSTGWTLDAGKVPASAAEAAIRGAADVAIMQVGQHGDHCMNSVADAMTALAVEGVRGETPHSAAAIDRHGGFGATDGYLVAGLSPTPSAIAVGDRCMGEDEMLSVATPATIVAFVTLPDLDSARAEARRLVIR